MDILGGLSTFGTYINNKKVVDNKKKNNNVIKRSQLNGNNIYNSNNYTKNRVGMQRTADSNYSFARHTKETGVVPNLYNRVEDYNNRNAHKVNVEHFSNDSDSVFSINGSCDSVKSFGLEKNHTAFLDQADRFKRPEEFKSKIDNDNNKDSFLSQFGELTFDNPSNPVSSNNTPNVMGCGANIKRLEMERELASKGNFSAFNSGDMTYGVVGKDSFVHNNMVPHFSNKLGMGEGDHSKLNNTNQRRMDLFTGSLNNLDYRPKTERRPLFNPVADMTYIYGTPSFTDYMQTRFIPGKERRNEYVVQPIRETPGLNLNYNEVSNMGFQDTYRVLPKTVDELRAANKPKISYGTQVVPGLKGERRSIIPNVAKRHPNRFVENDPRDLQKSRSYYTAPTIYGSHDAPLTAREETATEYHGPARYAYTDSWNKPESMQEQQRISRKENFSTDAPRNITGVNQEKNTSYTAGNYQAPQTMRSTTQNNTYNGQIGTVQFDKGGYGPQQDGTYAPNTMRQLTQNNTYAGQAFNQDLSKGGYGPQQDGTYAPNTLRQLTQNNTYAGQAYNQDLSKGGYGPQQDGTYAPNTMRQLTQNNTYAGQAYNQDLSKGGYGPQQDGTYAPNTLRQLTQNNTYAGQAYNQDLSKGGYGPEQDGTYAPNTLRQLTQNNTYNGQVGTNQLNKGGYGPEQDGTYAPNTLRQLTQNNTYNGQVGTNQLNKGGYGPEQDGTYAPNTLRQLTQNNTYNGQVGTVQLNKGGYGPEQDGTYAPNTLRQLTQNKTHINPAILVEGLKQRNRADANNSLVNIGKEEVVVIRDNGAPTTSNYEMIPTFENTMVELCEPIQVNRDLYGTMVGQRPLQCVPTMYTRIGNQLPEQSWRFDTCVTSNLANNPYINNTQHKAAIY